MITDTRDTTVRGNYTALTTGNQRFTLGFNQTIPSGMIDTVSTTYRNARQRDTKRECPIADARDAVGNFNARQRVATVERPLADARHAVRNFNARQRKAIGERTIADAACIGT